MIAEIPYRNILMALVLLSALANLAMGILVLLDSPRRKVNWLFAVLCFTISFWGIAFLGFCLTKDPAIFLIWSRLYSCALILIPPLFYHLVLGSVGTPTKGQNPLINQFALRVKQLAYVFSFGWIIFMLGGVFPLEEIQRGTFHPELSQQFWIAAGAYAFVTLMAISLLVKNIRRAIDQNQKNRLYYLLFATSAILVGSVINFLFMHQLTFQSVWIIGVGHVASTLCLVLIAYSLNTNQMYQFSEFFRKTISYVMMTMILLSVFGGTLFFSSLIIVPFFPKSDYIALGVASVIMSFIFHPLRFRVQNLVDKVFFPKRFDQMQHLRRLSRQVLSATDRDELTTILFKSLKEIGFGSIAVLLKDPQKPLFQIKRAEGLGEKGEGFFLRNDSLLIQYLREEKEELIRDEVLRRILADWERQDLGEEMNMLESEICFPLFSTRQRALFGLVSLGKSELGYSSFKGRNIFWLKSVIENAGIMLDNFYHHELANALIPYVGKSWAEEMRRNKEGFRERLSGHRTWVTVLMVDIRHFTSISSRLDAREVVGLLKHFRSRIAPIVYKYQGTIDKFIGDAVMVVFGLPILPELDNPDLHAVCCAMEIMEEIRKMNKESGEIGGREIISIGIGVSSGDVIAGNVDSGDRVEYTVIGDAANMVARLEDLAGENQILISPATYQNVKHNVQVHEWEPRHIAGFEEMISVYELQDIFDKATTLSEPPPSEPKPIAANQ